MILSLWRLGESSRVLAFTVHEPPNPPADRIDRAERLVFVKDGFSLAALLFGPLWLLVNRMWAALLAYLLAAVVLGTIIDLLKIPSFWASLTGIALNFIVALEADSIRRWTLERRGWDLVGTVVGRTTAECERRFFETWLPAQPILRPGAAAAGRPSALEHRSAAASSAAASLVAQPGGSTADRKSGSRGWRFFGRES